MDAFTAFCFGLWFGLTGPLALHVSIVFLSRHERHAKPPPEEIVLVRVLRFVGAPLFILGIFGFAGVFGFAREQANLVSVGMFSGFAAYGVFFFLYRRMSRVQTSTARSDRDVWLDQWQMTKAAGRRTFLIQHTLMGCVIGFGASLMLYSIGPRVGDVNIGDFPWVLGAFALFPLVLVGYACWTWSVSERIFHELRGDTST